MSAIARRSFSIAKHLITRQNIKFSILKIRSLSSVNALASESNSIHFRVTSTPHPLATNDDPKKATQYQQILGDHTGLQQNHIWTESELQEKLSVLYHHKPQTIADHFMHKLVSTSKYYLYF
jgi:hypothetical protein